MIAPVVAYLLFDYLAVNSRMFGLLIVCCLVVVVVLVAVAGVVVVLKLLSFHWQL